MVGDKVPGIVEGFVRGGHATTTTMMTMEEEMGELGDEVEEKVMALIKGMESYIFTATYKM